MPSGVAIRERSVDIATLGVGRSPRRWADAIDPVVRAVETAATGLDVGAEQVLTALLVQYGLAVDIPAEPASGVLARQLGPYLSGRAVQQRAGISRQALHGRRTRWAIIGVPTDDHTDPIVYPARQFSDLRHATVWPGVQQAAQLLAAGIDDPLTIAVWLDSANPDLDGHTAYDWFAAGGELERVAASAQRDARRLRQ
jgi:hypothetical protein